MTEKEFQHELDRIYFRYCPFLIKGAKYDVKVAMFKEHMTRMKQEVMALQGVSEELKTNAGNDIQRRIVEFVINHNNQESSGE